MLIIFSLTACSDSYKTPDNLIDADKMTNIIYDIHVGDAVIANHQRIYSKHKAKPKAYYESIYKKYNITREQYDASLEYFSRHPEILEKIYNEITEKIEQEKKIVEENKVSKPVDKEE